MCSLWTVFGNRGHEEECRTSRIFLQVNEMKVGGMRDRRRSTWAQMLTFCCTGVCILLLVGIVVC